MSKLFSHFTYLFEYNTFLLSWQRDIYVVPLHKKFKKLKFMLAKFRNTLYNNKGQLFVPK